MLCRRAALLAFLLLLAPGARAETLFQKDFALLAVSAREFRKPEDLTLSPDGRFLLVADAGSDSVAVLDPKTLKLLGRFGQGDLARPHDVAFLNAGTVLVADTGHDRIAVYDFQGLAAGGGVKAAPLAAWRDGISVPEGIAVAPLGDAVYVANEGHNAVMKLDAAGTVVNKAGGYSRARMVDFTRPHGIAVHPDGRVFVSDSGDDRMVVLNPDLVYLQRFRGRPSAFDDPHYVTFDGDGNLWLADENNNRVLMLDSHHQIQVQIGSGNRGDGPGELNRPEGVAVRGRLVWITDTYNDRILLLRHLR